MNTCHTPVLPGGLFKRLHWVDNAKALALLLIMLVHTKLSFENDLFNHYQRSFQLPVFFFLAGYLLNVKHLNKDFISFIRMQFNRILIPYFAFWAISYIFWIPMNALKDSKGIQAGSLIYKPLIGLFYGINSLQPNPVLWFFTCIFIVSIMFFFLHKYIEKQPWIFFTLILLFGLFVAHIYNNPKIRLPWNSDVAFIALIYYSLGYILNAKGVINKMLFNHPINNLAVFILLTLILIIIVKINGAVSMGSMIFGNPFLFIIASITGIFSIIYLGSAIPRNIFLEWLSKNSIVIFPFHSILFSLFTGVGVVIFKMPYSFQEQPVYVALYMVGSIILCIPISCIIRKYAPVIIGGRK